jgi:putative acetyltransferase
MTYLPALHTPVEDVAFFSERVVPESWVRVAEVDGEGVIGFAAARGGWLDHLYVVPPHQGRGVGGELLRRAQADHPDGLLLWVFEENRRAQAFYARAGFVEILRTDGSDNEEKAPDVKMQWSGAIPRG